MKKIAILALIFFIIVASIFGIYIFTHNDSTPEYVEDTKLQEQILNNSSWVYLNKDDLNGYLNGTYTSSVQKIINSLEEAIPVIFQTSTNQFGNLENGSFIIASAFNTSNQVYVYYYDSTTNKYRKKVTSLENVLDDSTAAFIYTGTEVLQ